MTAAVRAELIKLRTVRANVVVWSLALVAGIGLSVLVLLVIPTGNDGLSETTDGFSLALSGLGTAQVLLGVLGVLAVTQEHRYTLRVTFAADPRRIRVMVAKVIAVMGVLAVAAVIVVPILLVIGGWILDARGFPLDVGGPGFWRATLGAVLLTMGHGVIGVAIGAILRNPAAAITLLVTWQVLVEGIVAAVLPKVGVWLPFTAGLEVTRIVPADPGLGPWAGFAWFCFVALGLFAIGVALTVRRDA